MIDDKFVDGWIGNGRPVLDLRTIGKDQLVKRKPQTETRTVWLNIDQDGWMGNPGDGSKEGQMRVLMMIALLVFKAKLLSPTDRGSKTATDWKKHLASATRTCHTWRYGTVA